MNVSPCVYFESNDVSQRHHTRLQYSTNRTATATQRHLGARSDELVEKSARRRHTNDLEQSMPDSDEAPRLSRNCSRRDGDVASRQSWGNWGPEDLLRFADGVHALNADLTVLRPFVSVADDAACLNDVDLVHRLGRS